MTDSSPRQEPDGADTRRLPTVMDAAKSLDSPREKSFIQGMGDFWTVLRYTLGFWPLLAMLGVVGLVGSALAPITAFLFAATVNAFLNVVSPDLAARTDVGSGDGFSIGAIAQQIVDRLGNTFGEGGLSTIVILVIAVAVASVLYQILLMAVKWLSFLVSTHSYYALQRDVYRNILYQPMKFFHHEQVGGLMSRLQNDVSASIAPVTEVLESLSYRVLTLIVMIFLMLLTSVQATLVVLAVGATIGLIPTVVGRRFQRFMSRQLSQQALVMSVMQEALISARLVKSFASEDRELAVYWKRAMRMFGIQRRIRAFRLLVESSTEISTVLTLSALLLMGGTLIRSGAVSVTEYLLLLYLARESGKLLAGLSRNVMLLFAVLGASERVVGLLNARSSVVDGKTPKTEFRDSVELRNVSYDYGSGPVLKDINLKFRKGEFVAFVGPSGSGKSTLLDLILRLDDPNKGLVLVDGTDIREFTQKTYRRLYGVVGQETLLFNDTVANNISYAANGVSQAQIERAATAANAHPFIAAFPEKYQTYVGERGVRISGGERQRLAIARALVSEPQLLLFDEATSSLDSMSERHVQDAIDGLVNTRTAIVVAHRLSTITRADRIYVLDKGRIVESGNHEELVAANGLYADMLRLQANESDLPSESRVDSCGEHSVD